MGTVTADLSMLAPEDRALAEFIEAAMNDIADGVLADLVARLGEQAETQERLIADLVTAVNWYRTDGRTHGFDPVAVGRGLRYAKDHTR